MQQDTRPLMRSSGGDEIRRIRETLTREAATLRRQIRTQRAKLDRLEALLVDAEHGGDFTRVLRMGREHSYVVGLAPVDTSLARMSVLIEQMLPASSATTAPLSLSSQSPLLLTVARQHITLMYKSSERGGCYTGMCPWCGYIDFRLYPHDSPPAFLCGGCGKAGGQQEFMRNIARATLSLTSPLRAVAFPALKE